MSAFDLCRYKAGIHDCQCRSAAPGIKVGPQRIAHQAEPDYGAAQRDPREYDEPDRFDIHRKIDRHLSFGFGQHLCLGKSLARQECRVAFEEILARFPDYEIDEAGLVWAHNNNVRGYAKVPMRL